jgi:putative transport protein
MRIPGGEAMSWLAHLFTATQEVPTSLLVLALVSCLGLAAGSLAIRGIKLGAAAVLFVGILFGHFGLSVNHDVLHFVREFGLILFVYGVGITVGPGFVASFRSGGLRLNLVALVIVASGALVTVGIVRFAGIPMPIAVGMFSGATTNTPSLAAATQTLAENPPSTQVALEALAQVDPDKAQRLRAGTLTDSAQAALRKDTSRLPGLGYAVAYPFGVVGVMLSMLLLRALLGSKAKEEENNGEEVTAAPLASENFEITNDAIAGRKLGDIAVLKSLDLVVSRIRQGEVTEVARPHHILQRGDILLAVGTQNALLEMRTLCGKASDVDLRTLNDALNVQWLTLSNKPLVGKCAGDLRLGREAGVRLTRIRRGDVELHPAKDLRLQHGDALRVVGSEPGLAIARELIGDSRAALNHPDIVVVFLGIALGVILGSLPVFLPGMPAPVKLGMAGGPLLVAIFLSRLLRVGNMVTILPLSANVALKEFGITLFLAAVGLKSGESFVHTLLHGQGLTWMLWACAITLVPVGMGLMVARLGMKVSFPSMLGMLAGSMTDPPALAFSGTLTKSQATNIAYATVYPLTMILRIVAAQILVLVAGS